MISALNLLWIVPVAGFFGYKAGVLMALANEDVRGEYDKNDKT